MENFDALLEEWTKVGQGHAFAFWKELTLSQRDILCKQAQVCAPLAAAVGSHLRVLSVALPLLTSALLVFTHLQSIDVNMVVQVYNKLSQKGTLAVFAL